MATHASPAAPAPGATSPAAGIDATTYFVLRRLHSLLGVFPLGLFLANHLFINSFAGKGPEAFNEKVDLLRGLPMLPTIETVGIFAPLALHIILGIAIMRQARHNVGAHGYARNWAYTFQRMTGWLVLGFVVFHVWSLRFGNDPGKLSFYDLLHGMFHESTALLVLYVVGGLATIYHFCNGLCTFAMTWGLTIGKTSQRYAAIAATLIGLALTGLMAYGLAGFYAGKPLPF